MQRVLEPEVMDTADDAEQYDAMDFAEANLRFAEDALELMKDLGAPRVLDVGVGTGQIPELLLTRRGDLELVAIDLADEMLKVARRRLDAAGVLDRCELVKMDAKALDFPDRSFDAVLCNSTIHHIPEPALVWEQIARVCKSGGVIVVRDLARPASKEEAWAIVDRVAAGESARQRQLFFDSLCAALTVPEVDAMTHKAGLYDLRVALCSDRHWTAERPPSEETVPTRRPM